jgi:hypothetical protein
MFGDVLIWCCICYKAPNFGKQLFWIENEKRKSKTWRHMIVFVTFSAFVSSALHL